MKLSEGRKCTSAILISESHIQSAHPINTIYDLQARSLEFSAYSTTITIKKQSTQYPSSGDALTVITFLEL